MAKETIVLARFEVDYESLLKSIRDTQKEIEELEKKQDKLIGKGKESSAKFKENAEEIKRLTASLQAQQAVYDAGTQALARQTKTFNEYKNQVTEAAQSINLFNGGLGGFISRAQEAGGVGPLVSGAFKGMAAGIGGMTKAALAFVATPLGAVITLLAAVLSPVISYFKNTQEGIDKVTAVTRPLQAVFQALTGVFQNVGKYIVDLFTNPRKSIEDFAGAIKRNIINRFTGLLELIPNLGKAIGLLFSGEFSKAGKVAADAVGKVALGTENITDKVAKAASATGKFLTDAYNRGQKIDQLQKALDKGLAGYTKRTSELKSELEKQNKTVDNTNKSFAEREAAAAKGLNIIREQNRLMVKRLDQELQLLKLKLSANGLTDEENAQIASMVAKRKEAAEKGAEAEKNQIGKIKAVRNEANTEARKQRQEALQDYAEKQKLEVDLLESAKEEKFSSLKDELQYNKRLYEEKLQAAKADFDTTKQTENDKIKLAVSKNEIEKEYRKNNADAAIAFAEKEVEAIREANKKKIDDNVFISQQIYDQEITRLNNIVEADKSLQKTKLDNGAISQEEYNNAIKAIDEKFAQEKLTLDQKRKEDEDKAKAIDLENKRAIDTVNRDYDLNFQLENLDAQKKQELEAAEKTGADKTLIEAKYAKMEQDVRAKVMENKIALAQSTFMNLATIVGKEGVASKAMAIAQATMDTYKAAVSAYSSMSGIPVVGPTLGAIAAGAAVASGLANVKKIASTKAPKAEKGALFSIGGRRHSAGGTMFRGEDGTAFEAEQGELIGVMNRNAARHFMAFNNAFPAGSGGTSGNYFEGGGIVSREIASPAINADELAAKIAEANRALPAPVVAVQDIISESSSFVKVRDGASF